MYKYHIYLTEVIGLLSGRYFATEMWGWVIENWEQESYLDKDPLVPM